MSAANPGRNSISTQHSLDNSPPLKDRPKITRRKHKKSRVGCPQCRKRKVKCDETLPACYRCINRRERCGYLDMTPREIDLIKLAHWEAQGADPSKIPIQAQEYNPQKNVAVYSQVDYPFDASEFSQEFQAPIQAHRQSLPHNISHNPLINNYNKTESTCSSHGEETDFSLSPFNDSRSPLSDVSSVQIFPQNLNLDSIRDTTPTNNNNTNTNTTDTTTNNNKEASLDSSFKFKPIKHIERMPKVDLSEYPTYFNETVPCYGARIYIKRLLHTQMTLSEKNIHVFYGSLVFGYAPLLKKYPFLKKRFLELRGESMTFILNEISNLSDDNILPLLRTSVMLNCTSIFLKGEINYRNHFKFSTGPISIMKKAYEDPSLYPKSFPRAIKTFADMNLYTAKYVWVPQYNHEVLYEFFDVVKEFGSKFILPFGIKENIDDQLKTQYADMIDFIEFCLNLLKDEKSNDLVLRYPIDKLYELFQRWYYIVPSDIYTMSSKTESTHKVFYVLWFTLLKLLESVIISCRYIFSYFLDGFFLIYTFQRDTIEKNINNDELKWYFNYCCRIISFFDRRICYVMSNTILKEPLPVFLELKDRLKARPLDIHERCITSFRDTVIKKFHYPTESTRSTGFTSKELVNYYLSNDDTRKLSDDSEENASYNKPKSSNDLLDLGLLQYLKEFGTDDDSDSNKVDLLNDVNPKTSLLKSDYDPRFTDPIFNEPNVFQAADLKFFDRYIEDRNILVNMPIEGEDIEMGKEK